VTLRCWSSASRDTSRFRSRLPSTTPTDDIDGVLPRIEHLVFPEPLAVPDRRKRRFEEEPT
jgi:hypothetical protein